MARLSSSTIGTAINLVTSGSSSGEGTALHCKFGWIYLQVREPRIGDCYEFGLCLLTEARSNQDWIEGERLGRNWIGDN